MIVARASAGPSSLVGRSPPPPRLTAPSSGASSSRESRDALPPHGSSSARLASRRADPCTSVGPRRTTVRPRSAHAVGRQETSGAPRRPLPDRRGRVPAWPPRGQRQRPPRRPSPICCGPERSREGCRHVADGQSDSAGADVDAEEAHASTIMPFMGRKTRTVILVATIPIVAFTIVGGFLGERSRAKTRIATSGFSRTWSPKSPASMLRKSTWMP